MAAEEVKRTYKDGIFRTLFNDEEKLLELYNAISGSDYPKGTPVQIVTLDNVIFKGIKNDLAFVIDDKFIILAEQQSTLSPNFPLRMLCYLAEEYKKLVYSKKIYSKRLIEIPTPELYVFYNGQEDAPVEWEMKLSDAFKGKCDKIAVEAIIKVVNVNYGKGAAILERCRTLQQYSLFMHKLNQRYQETGNLLASMRETIRECIESDILAEYLKERGKFMDILELNLTQEECEEIRFEDGLAIGAEKERMEIARKMKDSNMSIEQIKSLTGLTEEEIEQL